MKKYIYSVCFTFVLAAFTLFVVLDTFVISRPMEYVQEINTSMFSSNENVSRSDPAVNSEKTVITIARALITTTHLLKQVRKMRLQISHKIRVQFQRKIILRPPAGLFQLTALNCWENIRTIRQV